MSSKYLTSIALVLTSLSQAWAHGTVKTLLVDGKPVQGYNVDFAPYQKTPPVVAGWSMPDVKDHGFVKDVTSPDIICHRGATPGQTHADVPAGGKITFQWEKWPHDGPMLTYMANCNGPCESVDKTQLKFFKIDQLGLVDPRPKLPQGWATDKLKAENNSWTVTVPADIAPGNYVFRHETIALHEAQNAGGAQFYPQCVNFAVSGTGTANPPGVAGTSLYSATDDGIRFNMYYPVPTNYTIPGPALYSGAVSGGTPTVSGTPSPVPSSSDPSGQPSSGPIRKPYNFLGNSTQPGSQQTPGTYVTLSQTMADKKYGQKSLQLSSTPTTPTTVPTVDASGQNKGEKKAESGACSVATVTVYADRPSPSAKADAQSVSNQAAVSSSAPSYYTSAVDASVTTITPVIEAPTTTKTPVVVPVVASSGATYTYLPLDTHKPTNMTGVAVNTTKLRESEDDKSHKLPKDTPKKISATQDAPLIPANATWAEFWDWLQEVVKNHWYSKGKKEDGKDEKKKMPPAKRHHPRDLQFGLIT